MHYTIVLTEDERNQLRKVLARAFSYSGVIAHAALKTARKQLEEAKGE